MLISDFIAYLFNLPLDFFFRHVVMFSCFIEHLFSRFRHGFHHVAVDVVVKLQLSHKFVQFVQFVFKNKRADTRQPSSILHLTSYIPKVIPPAPRQSYRRPGCHLGQRHPR